MLKLGKHCSHLVQNLVLKLHGVARQTNWELEKERKHLEHSGGFRNDVSQSRNEVSFLQVCQMLNVVAKNKSRLGLLTHLFAFLYKCLITVMEALL